MFPLEATFEVDKPSIGAKKLAVLFLAVLPRSDGSPPAAPCKTQLPLSLEPLLIQKAAKYLSSKMGMAQFPPLESEMTSSISRDMDFKCATEGY